eukprot:10032861-Alexandrium_andersonii.AAC.1
MLSANKRAQRATAASLPGNVFYYAGSRAVHCAHRAVESSTDKAKLIGGVHAVAFSAGLVTHQEMLLRAAWQ